MLIAIQLKKFLCAKEVCVLRPSYKRCFFSIRDTDKSRELPNTRLVHSQSLFPTPHPDENQREIRTVGGDINNSKDGGSTDRIHKHFSQKPRDAPRLVKGWTNKIRISSETAGRDILAVVYTLNSNVLI